MVYTLLTNLNTLRSNVRIRIRVGSIPSHSLRPAECRSLQTWSHVQRTGTPLIHRHVHPADHGAIGEALWHIVVARVLGMAWRKHAVRTVQLLVAAAAHHKTAPRHSPHCTNVAAGHYHIACAVADP